MTHLAFIENLKTFPLDDAVYRKAGLSDEYIELKKAKYSPPQRNISQTPVNNDPIIALINEFDLEMVAIGMISFNAAIAYEGEYIVFGKFEIDTLAVSITTNEIVMLGGSSDRLMYYCAARSSNFLEATIYIGKFLMKRGVDEQLFDDEKANLVVAEQTAEIAGGEKYFDFYRMMLGF